MDITKYYFKSLFIFLDTLILGARWVCLQMHEFSLKYFKPQSLFSTAFITYTCSIYMDIGCDFARALAVVFQSIPVHNRPDTYDSLHVTSLALDVAPIAAVHANTSFKALLDASHLFSNTPLDGHMVCHYMELRIYYYKNLPSLKLDPLQKFILQKVGAIWYIYIYIYIYREREREMRIL